MKANKVDPDLDQKPEGRQLGKGGRLQTRKKMISGGLPVEGR